MNPIDLTVIVVYILGCTLLGSWLGSGSRDLRGYFLGERHVPTWAVMISIVGTETSAVTFLSVPGLSYKEGGNFTFLQLALGYIVGRMLVAALLLPGYFRGEIYSAYHVLGERFGPLTKGIASALFLGMRTVADGVRLTLTATVIHLLSGLGLVQSILLMGTVMIIYTYIGGMRAVIWTDVIQFFVYVAGAVAALLLLVGGLPGGWEAVFARPEKFRAFDFSMDFSNPYSFVTGLVGGVLLSMATHGADQLMVQRYLAARSRWHASAALIASGFVVFVQFGLFLLIGVALSARDGGGQLVPDRAFSTFLISEAMPVGLRGLIVAALFAAALSSSLAAAAAATLSDIIVPLRPKTDQATLLVWSKRLVIVWGIAQIGMALVTSRIEAQAINSVLTVASLTAGLLLGLFLLGLWVRRADQRASLIALAVGAATVGGTWAAVASKWVVLGFPWYAAIGAGTVLGVGALEAWITGGRGDDRMAKRVGVDRDDLADPGPP